MSKKRLGIAMLCVAGVVFFGVVWVYAPVPVALAFTMLGLVAAGLNVLFIGLDEEARRRKGEGG